MIFNEIFHIILFMKFIINYFNRTAFHIAIEKGKAEIVQTLIDCEKNDVTIKGILNSFI